MSPISNEAPDDTIIQGYLGLARQLRLWQGTVLRSAALSDIAEPGISEFWIIASQACNIYNPSLENVPAIELIAAKTINKADLRYPKGDHPRLLHTRVECESGEILLELNCLKRIWIQRASLTTLESRSILGHIKDQDNQSFDKQYLDNYIGWIARSYTRIALPDKFNYILKISKIQNVLDEKLARDADAIYGIYFGLSNENEEESIRLGEMLPPYDLDLIIITNRGYDPQNYVEKLTIALFEATVLDLHGQKNTRDQLAKEAGLRILRSGIKGHSVDRLTVAESKQLIRYTMLDHLSESSVSEK